jgi:hypothetical protein
MNDPLVSSVGVLDTNVLIDVQSVHDFAKTYEGLYATLGPAAVDHRDVVHRRARARESILLIIYLDSINGATFSLGPEALGTLTAKVPPEALTFERQYTGLFLHFVRGRVLPRWRFLGADQEPGWETFLSRAPALDEAEMRNPTGNRADAWLIALAKRLGLPLITNEGFKRSGYGVSEIGERAKAEGVTVLFPKDVYAGKIDEMAETARFLERFCDEAPAFIEEQPKQQNGLGVMFGLYRHFLLGETDGREAPVSVSLPPRS